MQLASAMLGWGFEPLAQVFYALELGTFTSLVNAANVCLIVSGTSHYWPGEAVLIVFMNSDGSETFCFVFVSPWFLP